MLVIIHGSRLKKMSHLRNQTLKPVPHMGLKSELHYTFHVVGIPKLRNYWKKYSQAIDTTGLGAVQTPLLETLLQGFPGGAVVENLPANAGDTGSSPGLGRSHMPRSSWPVSHNY